MKKCPECNHKLEKTEVKVEGAKSKAVSYQCANCDYFEFEPSSSAKVVAELKERETALTIKQKVIKLSKDRLGIYFSRDVVRSLDLKPGEDLYVSVPDRNHIILGLEHK